MEWFCKLATCRPKCLGYLGWRIMVGLRELWCAKITHFERICIIFGDDFGKNLMLIYKLINKYKNVNI